jgi:hypothetical protein
VSTTRMKHEPICCQRSSSGLHAGELVCPLPPVIGCIAVLILRKAPFLAFPFLVRDLSFSCATLLEAPPGFAPCV